MPNTITKILFRRGTDAQRRTITLNQGEPGITTDTLRLFVGNGSTLGGTPVSVVNYGIVSALSGSYISSGTQTYLTSAAFGLLSAAYIGDFIYDQNTTTIWSLTSTPTTTNVPLLSNLAAFTTSTVIDTSKLIYNTVAGIKTLSIKAGGVGATEINSSAIGAGLSGGSGTVISLAVGGVTNTTLASATNLNSIKATSTGNKSYTDLTLTQGQFVGYPNIVGGSLTGVTLSAGTGISLSANNNTLVFNFNNPGLLPLSGGTMTGTLSSTTNISVSTAPVGPYDLVNLSFVRTLSSVVNPSNFLPLSGGTLVGTVSSTTNISVSTVPVYPYDLTNLTYVSGVSANLQKGINNLASSITGYLPLTGGTLTGTVSSTTSFTVSTTPFRPYDVTNVTYVSGISATLQTNINSLQSTINNNFLALSGGTMTGSFTATRIYTPNAPLIGNEIVNKSYIDTNLSNYFTISGGIVNGTVIANNFYSSNTPSATTELTNKTYVDTQRLSATPPGMIAYFAMSAAPAGWLPANGAVLTIAGAYQALYNAIGQRWNIPGDVASIQFRLPDLRGVFVRGWNDGIVNTGAPNTYGSRAGSFGLYQTDALGITPDNGGTYNSIFVSTSRRGAYPTTDSINGMTAGGDFTDNNTSSVSRASANKASETRPVNMALLACIKY